VDKLQIIDILKQASAEVLKETKNLMGKPEGAMTFGRGAGGDLSSKLDLVAENAVLGIFERFEFKPTIIGEECGTIEGKDDGYLVMDALDGTTNATRGIPFSCCSLAYATHRKLSSVSDAVIVDLNSGDIYESSINRGSFMNGSRIRVHDSSSKLERVNDFIIGVNISGISVEKMEKVFQIISRCLHIRQFGANALELCFFSRALVDMYIDIRNKIRVTDMAAGYLIAKEAGGELFTPDGKYLDGELSQDIRLSFIAAKNREYLELLK
jgi:myo-inositol-1(or 4)-monophosphatase